MTFDEAMQPLFAYVDGLDDEGRDRIVTHPPELWFDAGKFINGQDNVGSTCLVDVAEQVGGCGVAAFHNPDVARDYDIYCITFGTKRVVTALKARAASTTPSVVESPPELPREAAMQEGVIVR